MATRDDSPTVSPIAGVVDYRSHVFREALNKIIELREVIGLLHCDVAVIPHDLFESYSVRFMEPFDLTPDTLDFSPRFFTLPPVSAHFKQEVEEVERRLQIDTGYNNPLFWKLPCPGPSGISPYRDTFEPYICNSEFETQNRESWFAEMLESYQQESRHAETRYWVIDCNYGSALIFAGPDETWHQGYDECLMQRMHMGTEPFWSPYRFYFEMTSRFIPPKEDASKPHMIFTVGDTTRGQGDDVLRSESEAFLTGLVHQLSHSLFENHHSIPILVISMQHGVKARITQVHFDARDQTVWVRQSRFLDFDTLEPTDDAWLMLRWLMCRPTGITAYPSTAGETSPLATGYQRPARGDAITVKG